MSKADEIQKYYEMLEKGVINQDEFEKMKNDIIENENEVNCEELKSKKVNDKRKIISIILSILPILAFLGIFGEIVPLVVLLVVIGDIMFLISKKNNKYTIIPCLIMIIFFIVNIIFQDIPKNTYKNEEKKYDSFINNSINLVNNSKNYASTNNNTTNSIATTQKKELTASEKMIMKIVNLMNNKLAFDTGNYVQGDIPAGEYAFIKYKNNGTYYCEKDQAGNIIDNEHFDSFGYVKVHELGNLKTDGVLVNISEFQNLGVSGAKELFQIINEISEYNQGGYYKVGVDIEEGDYIVESIGGSGYYAIMTGPVSNSNIVDNDNFEGKASINLKSNQYLKLSRSIITKK